MRTLRNVSLPSNHQIERPHGKVCPCLATVLITCTAGYARDFIETEQDPDAGIPMAFPSSAVTTSDDSEMMKDGTVE